jgi:hypothetical protein
MRWYVRSAERRPDPPPLASNERGFVWAVTAVWAVLLIVGVAMHSRLEADGRGWWVWTPVVAIALGLYGVRWLGSKGR